MFADYRFDSATPLYWQLMALIRRRIVAGEWRAGQRVPPVRDLAAEFGVNPNTMQRALSELEREGLLYSERTAGRYITWDAALIAAARDQLAREQTADFRRRMAAMGYSDEEMIALLRAAGADDGSDDG